MATVTQAPELAPADVPYPITAAVYEGMVDRGEIPHDRRVYLWGGMLFEKMAKTRAHAAVHNALNQALSRRLPPGFFVGVENPVRLDETHLPLPDLVVLSGRPLDFFSTRYPDGRDVLLVAEIAVTSLPEDLGTRLARYAAALPRADYLVVDVPGRRLLRHSVPRPGAGGGLGRYDVSETVGPGGVLRLNVAGTDLEPIPFEELLP